MDVSSQLSWAARRIQEPISEYANTGTLLLPLALPPNDMCASRWCGGCVAV